MFQFTIDELNAIGAANTTSEIKQQPHLWQDALELYSNKRQEIKQFLDDIISRFPHIYVILAGAGTSAYAGDTALPLLKQYGNTSSFDFESIPTTSLVSNPHSYLQADTPTLMISFARSGNSPESVAAVELGKQIVKDFYQITITCAPEGQLALAAQNDPKNLLLLMPPASNDKGFAMTGSFSCMALTLMLIFDQGRTAEQKDQLVKQLSEMGEQVIARENEIAALLDRQFDRVVYIGSGSLGGLTREAQLKILELTAGKVATVFDTSLGFRHGPKSFLDGNTLVFGMVSNDAYTRDYDLDILNEMQGDGIAALVAAITVEGTKNFDGPGFVFPQKYSSIPDPYLAFPYIIVAQTIALHSSVKVGNTPDTPSPSGTVNRVVKGVVIHPLP